MTERTYSEEDISKVMEFYNIHRYSKTYKQMASEYGIPVASFYYLVKKDTQKARVKGRDVTLAYIAETKRKHGRCSIKATASVLKVPYKQIEKWLTDAGYEASMAGGFIFSTADINRIVKMYERGIAADEIAATTPMGLHDAEAMQKLIDNNYKASKMTEFKKAADGFIKENGGDIMNVLNQDVVHITPLKTKNEWSKLKTVNEVFVPFKKEGDLVSVLGDCVEHKTGDTIKTQPTLQDTLKEIEHKIAEHNIEIKKLEGYRDTLKQAILILNAGL